ncbi:hypothetical protein H6G89_05570 [Oscillatoria sp. FACHB-1407]|uniref:hypothetical protein n=1 Tax=Oscillatoria sp. FACHB-1407 TaxID=2692847 RepID=UPI00168419A7|nr:hypothetical protein [Oscillatoria sp. FACHB-1407]MBD2460509.1 hypothetical protein [Oscillatoria sp. FACHB-1407]
MSSDRTSPAQNQSSEGQSDQVKAKVDPSANSQTQPHSLADQPESDPKTHHGRTSSDAVDDPE